MSTEYDSTNTVLDRLDDPRGERYTRDNVAAALDEGTDVLLRRTEILWDIVYFDAVARTGNITSRWEQAYLIANTQATFYCGLLNYTGGHWEHEFLGSPVFMNGAAGPVQVTSPWEALGLYHPEVISQEVFELPEWLVRVDRVTWSYRELDPQTGNSMRRFYNRFKDHEAGDPRFYTCNEDGLRTLRVSPVMSPTGTLYTYSGTRGLLRNDTEGELIGSAQPFMGLSNYWKMEEVTGTGDRLDAAGSNDLTPTASVTQVTGKNAFGVSIDEITLLQRTTGLPWIAPYGYAGWFKFADPLSSGNFLQAGSGFEPKLRLNDSVLRLNSPSAFTDGTTALSADTFYHIVLTYDGTTYKVYLNGVLEISKADSASFAGPGLRLGLHGTIAVTVDELGRYNQALDQEQINLLYNDGDGVFFPDTNYQGNRGTLRSTNDQVASNVLWGHPVRLHSDDGNLRVEFFRTTDDLAEVPSRYLRAVEDFACASVLSDEGPGQDLALSGLYSARFEMAVERLRKRVNSIRQQRTATIGGLAAGRGSTPYARLGQHYPEGS